MDSVFKRILDYIYKEKEYFDIIFDTDVIDNLSIDKIELLNYLEFSMIDNNLLKQSIRDNIIITDGDPKVILMILNDLVLYEGEYTIYINGDYASLNSYLVTRGNMIYKDAELNIKVNIDYSNNYNSLLKKDVTIIGDFDFVNTASKDFKNSSNIII